MKNIHDVLRQKEAELENVQREIDALRLAARLCTEPGESVAASASAESGNPKPVRSVPPAAPDKALKQFP